MSERWKKETVSQHGPVVGSALAARKQLRVTRRTSIVARLGFGGR